jgi:hypothetical protein
MYNAEILGLLSEESLELEADVLTSEFSACKPEESNVLRLIGLWWGMRFETLLWQVGAPFEANELLWFWSNMFKNDTQQFVGEIEDAHDADVVERHTQLAGLKTQPL